MGPSDRCVRLWRLGSPYALVPQEARGRSLHPMARPGRSRVFQGAECRDARSICGPNGRKYSPGRTSSKYRFTREIHSKISRRPGARPYQKGPEKRARRMVRPDRLEVVREHQARAQFESRLVFYSFRTHLAKVPRRRVSRVSRSQTYSSSINSRATRRCCCCG